jgi:hypothetical protein
VFWISKIFWNQITMKILAVLAYISASYSFLAPSAYHRPQSCVYLVSKEDRDVSNALFPSLLVTSMILAFPLVAGAVSGGGLDYAGTDITGQDFSKGNYKGKDFTQGRDLFE